LCKGHITDTNLHQVRFYSMILVYSQRRLIFSVSNNVIVTGTCPELENVVHMARARDVTGVKLVKICSPLQKLTGKWKGLYCNL
jgi:hypothetical protein